MPSILQTNITQFVEQPGRTIQRTQGGLDRMTVKLIGPYWLADAQRPGRGAPHPDFPMMFVVNSNTTNFKEGGLAEITVNYAGRTDTHGGTNFQSEVLESSTIQEGEVTYGVFSAIVTQTVIAPTPSGGAGLYTWKCAVNSYAIRYASLNTSRTYVTNYQPSGPLGGSASVLWSYTRFVGQGSPVEITLVGGQTPSHTSVNLPVTGLSSSTRPTGWTSKQIIGPWYENSETWSFRYENVATF